jgi:hypothetical protein
VRLEDAPLALGSASTMRRSRLRRRFISSTR